MEYILYDKPAGCIFCIPEQPANDRQGLIIHRSSHSFVMLNRYPYTNGHLLIAPYRHTAEIDNLSDEEMLNISTTLRQCCSILRRAIGPDGFNIGINLGKAAGAGVDEHIHIHIVPRWNGDTNFMSVMTDIRIMPENLLDTYDILLPSFMEFSRPLEKP
jgi:ATP adenylyltransferase